MPSGRLNSIIALMKSLHSRRARPAVCYDKSPFFCLISFHGEIYVSRSVCVAQMARKNHRGAFRTAIGYVLFVMGGTSVFVMLVVGLGGDWFFNEREYIHPGLRAAVTAGPAFFLRISASVLVLDWLFMGALIYICGLVLQPLKKSLFPRLVLAAISAFLSGAIVILIGPALETIDLPKPASGDILYIQTEQGWRAFPASTPTVARSIRLTFSEPNAHHTAPNTNITTDIGHGHPGPEYRLPSFSWLPEEFQAPLPSLSPEKTGSH